MEEPLYRSSEDALASGREVMERLLNHGHWTLGPRRYGNDAWTFSLECGPVRILAIPPMEKKDSDRPAMQIHTDVVPDVPIAFCVEVFYAPRPGAAWDTHGAMAMGKGTDPQWLVDVAVEDALQTLRSLAEHAELIEAVHGGLTPDQFLAKKAHQLVRWGRDTPQLERTAIRCSPGCMPMDYSQSQDRVAGERWKCPTHHATLACSGRDHTGLNHWRVVGR